MSERISSDKHYKKFHENHRVKVKFNIWKYPFTILSLNFIKRSIVMNDTIHKHISTPHELLNRVKD